MRTNFQGLVLSFLHVGPRDPTQVVRLLFWRVAQAISKLAAILLSTDVQHHLV